jgi:hypothetical protein
MKKFLLAAALTGTTIAGAACAQTAPEAPRAAARGMARADGDGDGRVSKAEYIARADERFARMDKNSDGQLSADEMAPRREMAAAPAAPAGADTAPPAAPPAAGAMRSRMFERLDTNHDGMVSRDEYRAQVAERFDRLDTNHDGFLDQAEMTAGRDRARGMMQRGGDSPPPPPQNPGQ